MSFIDRWTPLTPAPLKVAPTTSQPRSTEELEAKNALLEELRASVMEHHRCTRSTEDIALIAHLQAQVDKLKTLLCMAAAITSDDVSGKAVYNIAARELRRAFDINDPTTWSDQP